MATRRESAGLNNFRHTHAEMRGDDFLEWIKANELFKHIPVIMLSSEDSTTERIRLLEIGAEDYIVKPFNPMELKIRVKR